MIKASGEWFMHKRFEEELSRTWETLQFRVRRRLSVRMSPEINFSTRIMWFRAMTEVFCAEVIYGHLVTRRWKWFQGQSWGYFEELLPSHPSRCPV